MKRHNLYPDEESEKQREVRNKISNFIWEWRFFFFLEYLVFLTHTHTHGEGRRPFKETYSGVYPKGRVVQPTHSEQW